jgi:hypothetical protein
MQMYNHAPLKQRIVTSQRPQTAFHAAYNGPLRDPAYKQWGPDNLMNAIEAVERGQSLRSSAIMYGIPRFTLSDHMR